MTDYAINLEETLSIKDSWGYETEVDAVIYRNQFDKYYQAYSKSGLQEDLMFSFIFLQIYIECFLHGCMRKIVEMEFKPPRINVYKDWTGGEKRSVQDKLDAFVGLFFSLITDKINDDKDEIKRLFGSISYIRNLLVHGHKVAMWSNSDGYSGISEAKAFLTSDQLGNTVKEANKLGALWNQLLDTILPQLKALQRVSDFKYKEI